VRSNEPYVAPTLSGTRGRGEAAQEVLQTMSVARAAHGVTYSPMLHELEAAAQVLRARFHTHAL
jgi:hypothetical protein